MFLSRKCANTRSTKALRNYFALAESQPTSATLINFILGANIMNIPTNISIIIFI